MKYAICGVNGYIGSHLSLYLQENGHEIVGIYREDFEQFPSVTLLKKLKNTDCVINLSGAPIYKRWTKKYKTILYKSRIDTTRRIVDIINHLDSPPHCFINASAIGFYAEHVCYNEFNAQKEDNFLSQLCYEWENASQHLRGDVKRIVTRFGLVMSKDGGILLRNIQIAKDLGRLLRLEPVQIPYHGFI